MSPMTWEVDTGPQSKFVAVHGTPDAYSLSALHATLTRHLARRPDCLILDLPDMSASDRIMVSDSAPTAGYGSMVSGTTVLLCAEPSIDVTVRRRPPGRSAALARRFARARDALSVGLLRSPSFVEQILPIAGSARRTREIVATACLAWGLTHLTRAAALLASELVERAIRQASTIMTVVALLDRDMLYLWVRTGSAPSAEPPDQGRAGLEVILIDALADQWGLLPDDPDTVIWAAIPVDVEAAR